MDTRISHIVHKIANRLSRTDLIKHYDNIENIKRRRFNFWYLILIGLGIFLSSLIYNIAAELADKLIK